MARPRLYPRYTDRAGDEWLVLLRGDPLKGVTIKEDFTDKDIEMILSVVNGSLKAAATWWNIEVGVPLRLFLEASDDVLWCIRESRENSSRFRWLVNKAEKWHSKIVERVNELMEASDGSGTATKG